MSKERRRADLKTYVLKGGLLGSRDIKERGHTQLLGNLPPGGEGLTPIVWAIGDVSLLRGRFFIRIEIFGVDS